MILTITISVILSTIINAYLNYKLVYIYINKRKTKDNEVKK